MAWLPAQQIVESSDEEAKPSVAIMLATYQTAQVNGDIPESPIADLTRRVIAGHIFRSLLGSCALLREIEEAESLLSRVSVGNA